MTLVRGRHTFKWGGSYIRTSVYLIFSGNERGRALMGPILGIQWPTSCCNLSRSTATPTPTYVSNHVYTHFSDSWKANQNLTIDYGLAYSYNGQPYEIANRIQSFFIEPINGVPEFSLHLAETTVFRGHSCSRTLITSILVWGSPGSLRLGQDCRARGSRKSP